MLEMFYHAMNKHMVSNLVESAKEGYGESALILLEIIRGWLSNNIDGRQSTLNDNDNYITVTIHVDVANYLLEAITGIVNGKDANEALLIKKPGRGRKPDLGVLLKEITIAVAIKIYMQEQGFTLDDACEMIENDDKRFPGVISSYAKDSYMKHHDKLPTYNKSTN